MFFEVSVIRLPPVLRSDAGGLRQVEVEAPTVEAALEGLVEQYPALRERVYDGGNVPPFLNVFIDGDDIRVRDGLATAVSPGSTILLLPAVAGGSPPSPRAPHA
jgi:molybdopterin converting factor small subunit